MYFTDKEDILRTLTKRISLNILKTTYEQVKDLQIQFEEKVVIMAEFLLDLFQNDKDMLVVMKKDFIWPISEEEFLLTSDETLSSIRHDIEEYASQVSLTEHQILVRLYALISMLCSISYSSIIDQFPDTIESLKPEVLSMLKQSFK